MKKVTLLLLPMIFFAVNLVTLSDYNINWDEPAHFFRGQAYLRYLLTGKTTYGDLPMFQQFRASLLDKSKEVNNVYRYSIYQSEVLEAASYLVADEGHPPLNGILASAFNLIFYQKLGIWGDVEAYHLFILLMATVLIFVVVFWSMEVSGWFAGIISFLVLALYPMFIAESHNNIKDPVEATFFTLAIYLFYRATRDKSWKFMLGSAVLTGMALATKFNILFAPFIILPWLTTIFLPKLVANKFKIRLRRPMILSLLVFPLIVLAIFYLSWPYLWADPLARTGKIIGYYRQIGTGSSQPGFEFWGFNTYPIQWILFTTPPVTLLLTAAGMLAAFWQSRRDPSKTSLLWFFWLLVPMVRVSLPGASIYGGTRQIMEYIPAMAMLAGLGAGQIAELFYNYIGKKQLRIYLQILVVASFIPISLKMVQLHPNQGLYFNTFIGGLPGAAKRNFPGWGTTLGNPYLQGVKWLNNHAEPNARLAIALGTLPNIPFTTVRSDISYTNIHKSVHWREGEYVIGHTYSEFSIPFYDAIYYERFLTPVHDVKVDGVPIVRIWKNEEEYVNPGFLIETEVGPLRNPTMKRGQVEVELDKPIYLTKLHYSYFPQDCQNKEDAVLYTSVDGNSWKREPETLLSNQVPRVKKEINKGIIVHFIAAEPTKIIRIEANEKSCLLNQPRLRVFGLRDISP